MGRRGRYELLLFGAALIWGSSFFMVKQAVDVVPTCLLLAIRFIVAAAILGLVFRNRLRAHLNRAIVWRGSVLGALIFGGYLLQTIGITMTTPGRNAFLTTAYCVMVPFLYWLVAKKRPDLYEVVAAFILIAGIGFISFDGGFSMNPGDLLSLLSGVLYALQIIAIERFARTCDVYVLTILQFLVAGVISTACGLLFEQIPALDIWSPSLIAEVAYLAIACTALALLMQNVGQAHVRPAAASVILSLEGVFGVIFSMVFYGEQLTLRLFIGFALIFSAVIISQTKPSLKTR